jgi:hypothetical protein
MQFKNGVTLPAERLNCTDIIRAMVNIEDIFNRYKIQFVITSIYDGNHMKGTLHATGQAFDVRTRDMASTEGLAKLLTRRIQIILGADWDVILEDDHIHIEHDPRS